MNNEHGKPRLAQDHWKMVFLRFNTIFPLKLSCWFKAMSPKRSEQTCRGLMHVSFSFCLITLYMTLRSNFLINRINFILWHKLLPCLQQGESLCQGIKLILLMRKLDLNVIYNAEASPVSLMNGLFKTVLPLKLLYQLKALSSRRPELKCRGFQSVPDKWPLWDHFATKTFISTQNSVSQANDSKLCLLREWLKALSPGRTAESLVSQETWTVNVHSQGFPRVTDEQLFQIHLAN